jgi:hypothetical protein
MDLDAHRKAAVLKIFDNVEEVLLRMLNEGKVRGTHRRTDRPLKLGRQESAVDYPGRVEDTW